MRLVTHKWSLDWLERVDMAGGTSIYYSDHSDPRRSVYLCM